MKLLLKKIKENITLLISVITTLSLVISSIVAMSIRYVEINDMLSHYQKDIEHIHKLERKVDSLNIITKFASDTSISPYVTKRSYNISEEFHARVFNSTYYHKQPYGQWGNKL